MMDITLSHRRCGIEHDPDRTAFTRGERRACPVRRLDPELPASVDRPADPDGAGRDAPWRPSRSEKADAA
ncbi:MAG: hypothetical protein H0T72_00070 [Chloroflexia bacterium]|nr:hypothetical protein [Chloroflexia bacterium]